MLVGVHVLHEIVIRRMELAPTVAPSLRGTVRDHAYARLMNNVATSRIDTLERLLVQRHSSQRILIFCEFEATIATITKCLQLTIPYAVFGGHATTRRRMVREYKAGKKPILILNSQHNAAGIDLPETTDIILYTEMTPATEKQAIGRGQRIGRTTPLTVHRFSVTPENSSIERPDRSVEG